MKTLILNKHTHINSIRHDTSCIHCHCIFVLISSGRGFIKRIFRRFSVVDTLWSRNGTGHQYQNDSSKFINRQFHVEIVIVCVSTVVHIFPGANKFPFLIINFFFSVETSVPVKEFFYLKLLIIENLNKARRFYRYLDQKL